jgi:peptide/nickel transport system substrate-binding protein
MKLLFGAVMILFIITALFTCNKNSEEENLKKQGGTVTVAIQGSANNLFPYNIREYYVQEVSHNLLTQSLTHIGPDGDISPELATSWEIDSAGITYFLDSKRFWSNGDQVLAGDILASFKFLKQNRAQVSTLFKTQFVKNVLVIDSFTVRFELKREALSPHAICRFPVLNQKQIIKAGDWENLKKSYYKKFIGCGPFVLKRYSSESVYLEKNPRFQAGLPFLDAINFRFYSDTDSLETWLQTETVDLVPDLPHNLLKTLKNKNFYTIVPSVEPGYTFIGWNLSRPEVANRAFRKGLSLALDRQTMVDGVMSGYATVYDAPAYPEFWAYYDTPPMAFDLEKAHGFLKKAGWARNKNTRKLEKNGEIMQLTILTNKENKLRVKIASNIKAYWESIGAEVELKSLAWGDFLQALKEKKYDAALVSWVAVDAFDPSELYHSSGIKSDNNFMGFANDTVDTFIENALSLKNKNARAQNWLLFQKKIIEELPVTVLFGKRLVNVVSKKLKNVKINSHGFLYNAKEYWLDDRK